MLMYIYVLIITDENKFGQKLMEKFGWSKGKGLGREEQGMTDCIKVLTKDNKKGMDLLYKL